MILNPDDSEKFNLSILETVSESLKKLPSKEYARMEAIDPNESNDEELIFPESSTTEFLLERQGKLLVALQTTLLNFDIRDNVKEFVSLTNAFETHMAVYHMIGGALIDSICNEDLI